MAYAKLDNLVWGYDDRPITSVSFLGEKLMTQCEYCRVYLREDEIKNGKCPNCGAVLSKRVGGVHIDQAPWIPSTWGMISGTYSLEAYQSRMPICGTYTGPWPPWKSHAPTNYDEDDE